MQWDDAGWPRATGGDLSAALPMPTGLRGGAHGIAHSDDFAKPAFGTRWSFYDGAPDEAQRASFRDGALELAAKGTSPADSSPLTQVVGDHAYEITVDMEILGDAQGGLLLFYNDRLFLGMGHDGKRMTTWRGGRASFWQEPAPASRRINLRIVNDCNIVTFCYSTDGETWTRHGIRSEVSGYNANTVDDLSSLRPALYAAGSGAVRFSRYRYRALTPGAVS